MIYSQKHSSSVHTRCILLNNTAYYAYYYYADDDNFGLDQEFFFLSENH